MNLLELKTKELLSKFGAGDAKPGSGSASAITALIAAEMIVTVVDVTCKSNIYRVKHKELRAIQSRLRDEVIPKLEILFQKDSDLFLDVHKLRLKRDKATNHKAIVEIKGQILEALVPCIEAPIEIANLAVEVVKDAITVFDIGAWWVKGDSQVAVSNAIASIASCQSIVNLNLSFFPLSEWTQEIRLTESMLDREYKLLLEESSLRKDQLRTWSKAKSSLKYELRRLADDFKAKSKKPSNREIETLVRHIQKLIYENQNLIWSNKKPSNIIGLWNSKRVFKLLDYNCEYEKTLGTNQSNEEIAGIIDSNILEVRVSEQYPQAVQHFTLAHELGHAFMHTDMINHRERPFEKAIKVVRPPKEYQADKFASYFLMPRKLVIREFEDLFGLEQIALNEDNSRMIAKMSLSQLSPKLRSLRDWSRLVASINPLGGRSIAEVFNVSNEAMSIRLEELNLVAY